MIVSLRWPGIVGGGVAGSAYCPDGSQGPGLVLPLYGVVAALVLIAGVPRAEDKPDAEAETRS